MGCAGCFDDFGGPWDIIDDLSKILWIDDDDHRNSPFLRQNRLSRRRYPAAQYHLTAKGLFLFTNNLLTLEF